jgi:RNA polymerase sigma-70 factor, ECF subfamily
MREDHRGVTPVAVGAAGEGISLEQAFKAHASYVATIGYRVLGTRDELDDLVQDVFLSAQGTLRTLRHPEAIKSWLATVTVRVARQRLRARRLRRFLHLPTSSVTSEEMPDRAASPETKSLVQDVFRALESLPVNARLAWSLRFLQGERLESVAQLCGCSLATVKRRLATAQAVLDKVLGRHE